MNQRTLPNTLLAFFLLMQLWSCSRYLSHRSIRHDEQSGITIVTDTLYIDESDYVSVSPFYTMRLEQVVNYHEQYFCLFYKVRNVVPAFMVYHETGYMCLAVSEKDGTITPIQLPQEDDRSISNLVALNDTLFCCLSNSQEGFYYDETKQQWASVAIVPKSYEFEDDNYLISDYDRGEWGRFAKFHDKHSGEEYLYRSDIPETQYRILGYNDAYYIINNFAIYKVLEPKSGLIMTDSDDWTHYFENTPNPKAVLRSKYSNVFEYFYRIYHDSDKSKDTLYYTGYLRNNELYLVMKEQKDMILAQYTRGPQAGYRKLLTIDLPSEFVQDYCQNPSALMLHASPSFSTSYLANFKGDTIHQVLFERKVDSLQYIGRESLDKALNYLFNNMKQADEQSVKNFEQQIGGICDGQIFPTHSDGFANFKVINSKSVDDSPNYGIGYYHAIDENDTFSIGYSFDKESHILQAAILRFRPTEIISFKEGYRTKMEKRKIDNVVLKSIVQSYFSVPDSSGMWRNNETGLSARLYDSELQIY